LRILHLSADYPDPVQPRKTLAIANLIALVPEHEHLVLSLNRRGGFIDPGAWSGAVALAPFADAAGRHLAVTYRAPPMGILHRHSLERLADRLEGPARAFAPDLVHAHKLTVEGIVGARLAARLGLPFLLTVQGNTDLKIAGARPALRPLLARIWREAAVVLPEGAVLLVERLVETEPDAVGLDDLRRAPLPAGESRGIRRERREQEEDDHAHDDDHEDHRDHTAHDVRAHGCSSALRRPRSGRPAVTGRSGRIRR
jgi:hypothetical protein